MQIDADSTSP